MELNNFKWRTDEVILNSLLGAYYSNLEPVDPYRSHLYIHTYIHTYLRTYLLICMYGMWKKLKSYV